MANTKSAKKRIHVSQHRHSRNRLHMGQTRASVKRARLALASGDAEQAGEAVQAAVRQLDHAASKGVIHANNAARHKSRLMSQLATLQAQEK